MAIDFKAVVESPSKESVAPNKERISIEARGHGEENGSESRTKCCHLSEVLSGYHALTGTADHHQAEQEVAESIGDSHEYHEQKCGFVIKAVTTGIKRLKQS